MKQIFHETMTEIYQAAIPSASWEELLRDSPKNEKGQAIIPFSDYLISSRILDEIIEKVSRRHRLNGYEFQHLRTNIYLGPSPRSICPKKLEFTYNRP